MVLPARRAVAPCRHIDRLPRGGDRDIGAGYAMAAVGATVLYYLLAAVVVAVVVIVAVAVFATSWATLPLGVLSGLLYERSRA